MSTLARKPALDQGPTAEELALQIIKNSPGVNNPARYLRYLMTRPVDDLGQHLIALKIDNFKPSVRLHRQAAFGSQLETSRNGRQLRKALRDAPRERSRHAR